jgi:hypothetical protein
MNFRKRGVLLVAAMAASAAAIPAQSAPAFERCEHIFVDGPPICIGGSQCNETSEKLEKVTGQRWECLQ